MGKLGATDVARHAAPFVLAVPCGILPRLLLRLAAGLGMLPWGCGKSYLKTSPAVPWTLLGRTIG